MLPFIFKKQDKPLVVSAESVGVNMEGLLLNAMQNENGIYMTSAQTELFDALKGCGDNFIFHFDYGATHHLMPTYVSLDGKDPVLFGIMIMVLFGEDIIRIEATFSTVLTIVGVSYFYKSP